MKSADAKRISGVSLLGIALHRAAWALAASSLAPLAIDAQSYQLSAEFPPGPGGGCVRELRVSADGAWVVYEADETTLGVLELYSAPSDGSSAAVKLSGALLAEGDVSDFQISQDGARVLYRAKPTADPVYELYSVPIDGSASPARINGDLPPGGSVISYSFSPDGSRAVYLAHAAEDLHLELFGAPSDGSAGPVRISGTLANVGTFLVGAGGLVVFEADALGDGHSELFSAPTDGSGSPLQLTHLTEATWIQSLALTPAGDRAVYVEHRQNPQRQRLFSVPVDGSATPLELSNGAASHIESLCIASDGSRVICRASVLGNGVYELFSVPVDGSVDPVRLTPPLAAGRTVVEGSYAVTADGARVLYVADQVADDVFELWSAPSDGSAAAVRLNGALASGGDVHGVFGVPSVSAGGRVVYIADQDTSRWELYSVPADGSGGVVKLNDPLQPSQSLVVYSAGPPSSLPFGTSLTRAVFATSTFQGEWIPELVELFSVPVDGSASPVRLNAEPAGGGVVPGAGWGFALDRVVYVADEDTAQMDELYSVPLDGGPSRAKLNGPMPPSPPIADVWDMKFTRDGSRVLYIATPDYGRRELFSARAEGSGSPVKLNGPLPIPGPPPGVLTNIDVFEISADDERVVFTVSIDDFITSMRWRLFSAPVDGSSPAIQLDRWISGDESTLPDFQLSPDGQSVVFRRMDDRLFRVPIDGSGPLFELIPPPPSGQMLGNHRISADGSRVVFRAGSWNAFELYSVPLYPVRNPGDASVPVKLNAALVAGGEITHFEISPDGSRVVYRADQTVNERFEIFGVPIDGGAVVQLNGAFVPAGDIVSQEDFAISPDGSRVVYRADQTVDERFELFSVPVTGGTAVRLNGVLAAGGDVINDHRLPFAITPDGSRVLYLADQELDERVELYSVPTGGGVARKINGEMIPGGDVGEPYEQHPMRISSDSRYVVYEADQEQDERFELYCRRSDGTGTLVKLSGPLPAGGSVKTCAITPDSLRVVFSADRETDDVVELYKVPIRGGPRIRLSGPFVPGGDIWVFLPSFLISPDGGRVVYIADQDVDEVRELYASPLEPAPGPGPRAHPFSPPDRHATVRR